MHQTPDLPGTGPVTDDPNPDNTQGTIPTEPGTGPGTGPRVVENKGGAINPFGGAPTGGTGVENPSAPTESTEGGRSTRTFRCADVGNADCRWEVSGSTDDELMRRIDQHHREQHGLLEMGQDLISRIRNVIRERRAA
jgi:predicted small metal-binding protein